jgi:hypothetical protein
MEEYAVDPEPGMPVPAPAPAPGGAVGNCTCIKKEGGDSSDDSEDG